MLPFHIAIDGPVAAGKGTVARLVASRLGFLYVDTGAMYRATALLGNRYSVDWSNEEGLVVLLSEHKIRLHTPQEQERDGRSITVLLDGEDVSWEIRTEEMSKGSSVVSVHQGVRKALVEQQQKIAEFNNVVMEGRDITSRVLPNAQLKIYLDASAEVRAKRRHQELLVRGQDVGFETVYAELKERDERDMKRSVDPLRIVEGAWVLDTTPLSIDEVVDVICLRVQEMRADSQ